MSYQEAIEYQENEYLKGTYLTVNQEHDSIGDWYLMPTSKEKALKEITRRK